MRTSRVSPAIGALVAGSLFVTATGAAAASTTAPQINPWAALTALSGGAPAVALCGGAAAVAVAQNPGQGCVLPQVDAPPAVAQTVPPAPPVEAAGAGVGISPLLLALGALASGVWIYFIVKNDHNNNNNNSPV
jgi:hypothetical protein